MKTKVIIDSKAARQHLKETKGVKMTQKQLSEEIDYSEQNLISLQKEAPKTLKTVLKIQEITGAPLDVIIKEVPY